MTVHAVAREAPDPDLRRELRPGERLLWQGCPSPARLAWRRLPLSLFGIVWLGFSLLGSGGALTAPEDGHGGGTIAAAMFSTPFILAGVAMVGAAPLGLLQAWRTVYGITDRRLIVLDRTPVLGRMRWFTVAAINTCDRRDGRDGRGDLIFRRETERDADGDRRTTAIGFYVVAEVRQVEAVVLQLMEPSRTG